MIHRKTNSTFSRYPQKYGLLPAAGEENFWRFQAVSDDFVYSCTHCRPPRSAHTYIRIPCTRFASVNRSRDGIPCHTSTRPTHAQLRLCPLPLAPMARPSPWRLPLYLRGAASPLTTHGKLLQATRTVRALSKHCVRHRWRHTFQRCALRNTRFARSRPRSPPARWRDRDIGSPVRAA